MPRIHFGKGNGASKGFGRPKGSKTKLRWDVQVICEEQGFNPFEKLIDIAKNSKSSLAQFNAAAELASYIAPKLKAVEVSAENAIPFLLNLNLWKQENTNGSSET